MSNFPIETRQMIFNCQNYGEHHYLHFITFKKETCNLETFVKFATCISDVAPDAFVEAQAIAILFQSFFIYKISSYPWFLL